MVYYHHFDIGYYQPPPPEPWRTAPHRALFYDIAKGNTAFLSHLLDSSDTLSPNTRNAAGETPLLFAVRYAPEKEKLNIVKLLSQRLDILMSEGDEDGRTALHEAVLQDNPELVRYLMQWHADPEAKDKDGKTPIDLIAAADCPKVKKSLIEDPPIFLLTGKKKDLFYAVKKAAQHVPTAEEKPEPPSKSEILLRKFMAASAKFELGTIEKLLDDKNFDVHHREDLALRQAAFLGYHTMVSTLLAFGADPRKKNNEPLWYAVQNGNYDTIRLMLACRADPTEHMPEFRRKKICDSDILKMLENWCLEKNCLDEEDRDKDFSRTVKPRWGEKRKFKKTALPLIKQGNKDRLKDVFLNACKDNRPWTVHNIIKQGKLNDDQTLQWGIKFATQYDEKTGKSYRNKDIVRVLLEHGADPQKAADGFYDKLFSDRMTFNKQSDYQGTLAIMSLMEQFGASAKKAEDKYFGRKTAENDNAANTANAENNKKPKPHPEPAKPEIKIDINPFRRKP
ncbi:MAG: ankyrin repeat domain-containing protein [Micavibrio sp.]|nr:MAG: ankyrin repeat domain-containing protein [Micavibrio sp.]